MKTFWTNSPEKKASAILIFSVNPEQFEHNRLRKKTLPDMICLKFYSYILLKLIWGFCSSSRLQSVHWTPASVSGRRGWGWGRRECGQMTANKGNRGPASGVQLPPAAWTASSGCSESCLWEWEGPSAQSHVCHIVDEPDCGGARGRKLPRHKWHLPAHGRRGLERECESRHFSAISQIKWWKTQF